ncbi:cytochrome P450 2F2-like [Sinocyclocheilus grahami]|uniref:cytochrome P450 2F2-like n=1 Tax=Sinocyclocheilus grahami TaxID=75366 RepID=UPI0007AD1C10|nr:PREDICTED: cytochrome P450 2F2-like [Sinocyclocheilus grahami]
MLPALVLLCLGAFLLYLQFRIRRPKNFPPGPTPVPFFGNLHQLDRTNPLKDFDKFAQHYGSIYGLFIGSQPAVVLTGQKMIREALITKAVEFAGRSDNMMVSHVTQSKGVIMADYGESWREHRRFALSTLRNFGLGKRSMEQRILEEVKYICSHLEESAGKSIDPKHLYHQAASNIIASIIFGSRFNHQDEYFQTLIISIEKLTKIVIGQWAMLNEIAPVLRIFPLPFCKAFQYYGEIKNHILKVVDEHTRSRVTGEPRDLIDCYLEEIEKRVDQCTTFDVSQMATLLFDLFAAGTETTSNTLRTLTLYLMTHTHIQANFLTGANICLNIKIFNSSGMVTTNAQLRGYNIPKGTIIIPYLSSALREESQWKFPHEFNPQNFLNDKGEFVKPDAFMPFSAGSRVCLGENLARMELFLILVTVLRRFCLVWPEDAGEPDFKLIYGGTQSVKPYRLTVQLRTPGQTCKSVY